MKLKLTYIPYTNGVCIPHKHYDLHTDNDDEELDFNIACILPAGKEEVKILKKMVKFYNKENK